MTRTDFPFSMLMVQGCTSDAGKSTLVVGLCRLLARDGVAVAPFKPQNMALNSAVTVDGGEIGCAQALQAGGRFAAAFRLEPVLLKPSSDIGAQVIIHGRVRADMSAATTTGYKTTAMQAVLESHRASATPACWWKAPAARRKSICARATSPIWALPRRWIAR